MVRNPAITVRRADSLSDVDRAAWDALDHGPSPFLEYGFLRALEDTDSIGPGSGWDPCYLLAEVPASGHTPRLVGAVAAFVKSHSYGEYIFDFAWANASHRAGIPYFPKLVVAAPVTPATGPRLLVAPDADRERVVAALVAAVTDLAEDRRCSSIHWLHVTPGEVGELEAHGFVSRLAFQFHWRSRGYEDFDEFLAALTSRRRKQIRKERRRAREAIDDLVLVPGRELTPGKLATLDRFYRGTVYAHGGIDYLQPGFFDRLAELSPDRLRVAEARRGGDTVAGALFLETSGALYGRYWGADIDAEMLHFETAYYAGIDHCIARGIPLFEAGAQGEHKLLRGFEPAAVHSAHWIRHPDLAAGVRRFVAEEARAVRAHMSELEALLPYRSS